MLLDQAAHDGEPEAEAALGARDGLLLLHEHVEHALDQIRRYPHPVVLDAQHDALARVPGAHLDVSPPRAVLGGIRHQVEHDLRQPVRIGLHAKPGARHRVDQHAMRPRFEQRLRHLHRAQQRIGDFHRLLAQLDLAARDARYVEKIVDQARQVRRLPLEGAELRDLGAAQAHELDRGRDGGERVAQLVAQHGEELVLAPVGLAQCRSTRSRSAMFSRSERSSLAFCTAV